MSEGEFHVHGPHEHELEHAVEGGHTSGGIGHRAGGIGHMGTWAAAWTVSEGLF